MDDNITLEVINLRLALAASGRQLTDFSTKHLPDLLTKLSDDSGGEERRRQILEILTQLKRRLSSNPDAAVPVDVLLNEFGNEKATAFVRNFSYVFLKIGFNRLSPSDQINLAPKLLAVSRNKGYEQQLQIFCELLPVIWRYYYVNRKASDSTGPSKPSPLLDFTPGKIFSTDLICTFLNFCAEIILLPENAIFGHAPNVRQILGAALDASDDLPTAPTFVQPSFGGVSEIIKKCLLDETKSSLAYLLEPNTNVSSGSNFAETKIATIRMLADCRLPSEETAWIWALASCDSNHTIVHAAEMELKQAVGKSLNDVGALKKLYEFYLGTQKNQAIPENRRRAPISLRAKLKLMTYFLRSASMASTIFPQSIQLIFENWFGTDSDGRLRCSACEFALTVSQKLDDKMAAVFAPLLFSNVKKLIDETHDTKLACLCYQNLGALGKRYSRFVLVGNKRIEMIQELFDDLSQIDDKDICSNVQNCLLDWLDGFDLKGDNAHNESRTLLDALILAYAEHKNAKCRLAALRFIERLFSNDHAPSRFALFLAVNDADDKIKVEAKRILLAMEKDNCVASFDFASEFMYNKICAIRDQQQRPDSDHQSKSALSSETLIQAVVYLHRCLLRRVDQQQMDVDTDKDDESPVDDYLVDLKAYLDDSKRVNEWTPYFQLLLLCLDANAKDYEIWTYLHELIFAAPEAILSNHMLPLLRGMYPKFRETVETVKNEEIVAVCAEILAYCWVRDQKVDEISNVIETACQNLQKSEFVSMSKMYLAAFAITKSFPSANVSAEGNTFVRGTITKFCQTVSQWQMSNMDACSNALSIFAIGGYLTSALDDDLLLQLQTSLINVIDSRKDVVTTRHKQKCADFLNRWFVGQPMMKNSKDVVEKLIKTAEGPPNIGLQTNVGEALVSYCLSPIGCVPCARNKFYESLGDWRGRLSVCLEKKDESATETVGRLIWLIDYFLESNDSEKLRTNKNYKQATCIWTYVLLQQCGSCSVVQAQFDRLQTFLLSCLAEENDFTQDTASRSLSVIFQRAKSEQKSALTKSLRDKLTATTAKDTLLPYQELCALAYRNCQRPELIYDLMTLAMHNTPGKNVTESKSRSVAAHHSIRTLQPFYRLLIPSLHRYTFDPNTRVKRIFQNIWHALSSFNQLDENSAPLLESFAKEIFLELFDSLESSNSRFREASCAALSDFLNGPYVAAINLDTLGEMWLRVLRVADDTRESVRLTASKTAKHLRQFTIKLCAPTASPSVVLPIVLPQLIECSSQNFGPTIRLMSLVTLTVLIKETPPNMLKPYLASLMANFLEALSAVEMQEINYLAARATADELEMIDQARVSASKSSGIMQSLEFCARQVDGGVLEALTPKITQIFNSNTGFPTKIGACRLLIIVRTQMPTELRPFCGQLVKSLTRCLSDRNATIRKQAASTIGHLISLCNESISTQLFATIQQWFLDADNNHMETSCCYTLSAVAEYSPEVLKNYGRQIAPIVFLACQNEPLAPSDAATADTKDMKPIWEEILSELSLSVYIWDIYDFCARLLYETSSWRLKALCAKSFGALIAKTGSDLPYERIENMLSVLIKALEGRTWDGKDNVLSSLGVVAEKYSTILRERLSVEEKNTLMNALMKECQKAKDLSYRKVAIQQTGVVADCLQLTVWKMLFDVLSKHLETTVEEDEEFDDACRSAAFSALARCATPDIAHTYPSEVTNFSQMLQKRLVVSSWQHQLILLDAVLLLFAKNLTQYFCVADLLETVYTILENAHQGSLKERCLNVLRECCTDLFSSTPDPSRKKISIEIASRLINNEFLLGNAKDLIENVKLNVFS